MTAEDPYAPYFETSASSGNGNGHHKQPVPEVRDYGMILVGVCLVVLVWKRVARPSVAR